MDFWNKKKSFSEGRKWGRGYSFYRSPERAPSRSNGSTPTWLNKKKSFAFGNVRGLLRKARSRGLLLLGVIGGVYVGYYFFFSDAYRISDIRISGKQNVSEYAIRRIVDEQLDRRRLLFFSQRNIFWFEKGEAERRIRESYVLDGLSINKAFPNGLSVEIQEKVSTLVWVTKQGDHERYYYLDLHGVVLGEIPEDEADRLFLGEKKSEQGNGETVVELKDIGAENAKTVMPMGEEGVPVFPIVRDLSGNGIRVEDQVLQESTANFIVQLALRFQEKVPNIPLKYFATLEPMSTRVQGITEEGWEIYFEATKDLDTQLNNLALVLEKKITNRKGLQYIYLRFDERIYYK